MNARGTSALTILALAIVLTLVLVSSRAAVVEAVYPVEKAKRTFLDKVWSRISGFFDGAKARAENVQLKRYVEALSLTSVDIERLEVENARLRRALEYTAKTPEVWIAAEVLAREGGAAGTHKTLRVDKGSLAGIKEGSVVVAPEGLVGRVDLVTPHTSLISLITDSSVKVACEFEANDGKPARGIVTGGSEELLIVKYLRNEESLKPRQRVITSGLGGIFPKGLVIGTYLSGGEILPAVDYSALEDVFIRREK